MHSTEPGVTPVGLFRSSANTTSQLILTHGSAGWLGGWGGLGLGEWPIVYTWGLPYNECMKQLKGRTLYIKNPAAYRLAEQVSKKMGVTLTDAVIRSLEAQLQGPARPIDWEKVEAIQREIAALPILDSRSIDEILGYDEFGLPS